MKKPYDQLAIEELREINRAVNGSVEYASDIAQYGRAEYWEAAGKRGDCEDYALAKIKLLRDLGWPKETLDLGICKTQDGQGHAVLIAHTTNGDFILDNNSDKVLPWSAAPYRWIERSVDGDFRKWVSIP